MYVIKFKDTAMYYISPVEFTTNINDAVHFKSSEQANGVMASVQKSHYAEFEVVKL